MFALRVGGTWLGATTLATIAVLGTAPRLAATNMTGLSSVEVKAAFLYNFAKFAEWPSRPASESIAICIVGDEPVAVVLAETVRGKSIDGHPLDIAQPLDSAAWPGCAVLFIADAQTARSGLGLRGIKALPVLTVSDGKDFSHTGGMIEFYVDRGQMRFLVNVDTVERSGLHLSSRLLGLAKITRNGDSH